MASKNDHGYVFVVVLIIVTIAVLLVVGLSATHKRSLTTKTDQPAQLITEHKLLRGVAFTPKDFGLSGQDDFYDQVKSLGTSVNWHGDWADLSSTNKAPYSIFKRVSKAGLEPIILVGTHSEVNGKSTPIRPLTLETIENYKQWALAFVKLNKPRYFGMGNEVNIIAASEPADFDVIVKLINDTAAEIKQVSPDTKVFVSFQLEHMKGLNGGLFGGVNDATTAQWSILDRFNVDLFSFTTYPGLIYHTPDEIPADYYSEILSHTNKPIAFGEVGWSSKDVAKGWSSNAETQSQFAAQFLTSTETLKPVFSQWLLLYDQTTSPVFASMGLIETSGVHRPAFDVWTVTE